MYAILRGTFLQQECSFISYAFTMLHGSLAHLQIWIVPLSCQMISNTYNLVQSMEILMYVELRGIYALFLQRTQNYITCNTVTINEIELTWLWPRCFRYMIYPVLQINIQWRLMRNTQSGKVSKVYIFE